MNPQALAVIEADALYRNLNTGLDPSEELDLSLCFMDYAFECGAGDNDFHSIRAEAPKKYSTKAEQTAIVLRAINILLGQCRMKEYKRGIVEKAKAALGAHAVLSTSKGIDPNTRDDEGFTPLFNAVNHEDVTEVRQLLESGARVNDTCIFNKTPLYEAARFNNLALVRLLLEHGADPNIPDSRAWTPLDSACKEHDGRANIEMVQLLLAHGAKPELMRGPGVLPPSVATDESLKRVDRNNLQEVLKLVLLSIQIPSDAAPRSDSGLCEDSEAPRLLGNLHETCSVLIKDERFAAGELKKKYDGFVKQYADRWPSSLWNFFEFVSPSSKKILLSVDNSNSNQRDTYYTAFFREIVIVRTGEDQFECCLRRRATQLTT